MGVVVILCCEVWRINVHLIHPSRMLWCLCRELNFVRLSKLLVRRVPEALRTLLKENWEEFQSRRKEPIDPALIAGVWLIPTCSTVPPHSLSLYFLLEGRESLCRRE